MVAARTTAIDVFGSTSGEVETGSWFTPRESIVARFIFTPHSFGSEAFFRAVVAACACLSRPSVSVVRSVSHCADLRAYSLVLTGAVSRGGLCSRVDSWEGAKQVPRIQGGSMMRVRGW